MSSEAMSGWQNSPACCPNCASDGVPAELARRLAAVAVDVQGSDLLVAMEDPPNAEAAQQISVATGWPVKPVDE